MTAAPSYLIVGAGIFGVSTAYHLLKQHPRASITLVDRDAHDAERRVAASWDWNKVMRADYDDPTYCALALEAQDVFTGGGDDDGLWRPHFHQTGLYWMCGREILAGGITTGMTRLAGHAAVARFANMPVGIQGYTAAKGPFVGSLPPTRDNELKWWGQKIFRNTTEVLPGRFISAPPPDADYAQWAVSDRLKEDILAVSSVFYGPHVTRDWTFVKHRVCWLYTLLARNPFFLLRDFEVPDESWPWGRDAFTTSSDFIISPHAAAEGLYVATCGSFHGFKFFPIIGKYVVQMLEGTLSRELADKWAWDRERPDPAANPDWPSVEMRELLDGARTSRL
ncbi:sarcosine oxidase [Moelleriella libera RCEF 2490]|uniref:Sarcosine oxidase n=1 Tax=Moelleriella libera RCEF 2490 TaxID=1081109 RepID=A0A162IHF9_9HYPO|nr:sarcosine oxidase [Moelleriella libera RCEF 2490]